MTVTPELPKDEMPQVCEGQVTEDSTDGFPLTQRGPGCQLSVRITVQLELGYFSRAEFVSWLSHLLAV
jgi:hypothetical protein